MPKKSEQIQAPGYDTATLTAICYGSFLQLGWPVLHAVQQVVLAGTKKKWGDTITAEAAAGTVTITSQLPESASFDLLGKNKKNIARFKAAFTTVLKSASAEDIAAWQHALAQTELTTLATAEAENRELEELNRVMNLSKSNLWLTYGIIGINVLVFVAMAASGISVFEPKDGVEHLKWGASYGPLIFTGDWWRLFTNMFLHFGIIHLLLNMYALYSVSVYLEPMLGKLRFITAYICCGVLSSIVSLIWHKTPSIGAGASGAVFGMYGVFIALLSTKLLPKRITQGMLQSMAIFVGYNLLYGMKGGIDNAAHVGGLLSGLVFGYLFYLSMRPERPILRWHTACLAAVAATAAITVVYLQNQTGKYNDNDRKEILNEVNQTTYKDNDKYNTAVTEFVKLEEKAVAPVDSILSDDERVRLINSVSLPAWNKADSLLQSLKNANLAPELHKKLATLGQYVVLRKRHAVLTKELTIMPGNTALFAERDSVVVKINTLLAGN